MKSGEQYGIKLYSINNGLYKDLIQLYNEKKFDFLELLYVPKKEEGINELIENEIPVIVHAPSFSQGAAFALNTPIKNKVLAESIFRFAERLNAKHVIIHPDFGIKKNFVEFLKLYKDKNIMIENMPKKALKGETCLGYTQDEITEFTNIGNFEFCLDFTHAIKSAISQDKDYKMIIKDFATLKPKLFHICDGTLKTEVDEHLNLGDGEFDLKFIRRIIDKSKDKMVTFEVPKLNRLDNDIKNIEFFKKL